MNVQSLAQRFRPLAPSPGWRLVPIGGSALFLALYLLAALHYPGGSQADAGSPGFSWMHNYWCNLLNEQAINGAPNTARPIAIAAMIVLALTLLAFWVTAAISLRLRLRMKVLILFCGLSSVSFLPFLSSTHHDLVVNASSFLGLMAMLAIYAGIYQQRWTALFCLGLFNLLLVALNNYIYYTTSLYYLPLVQKFTFASFLLWVCLVTRKLSRQPLRYA